VGALIEPGDLITTLDDDSVMKLDFTVPSIHLASLKTGLPIAATSPAFAGRQFEGTVASINSRIDPVTRAIVVRAILPNPERLLKPGLLMQVELLKNPREVFW
jgi:membrane fusion protein (multidrug efflux system)